MQMALAHQPLHRHAPSDTPRVLRGAGCTYLSGCGG